MKFSIKDSFSKCDQIRRNLRIWSHLLKKSLMKKFIFCAVCWKILACVWRFLGDMHCRIKEKKFRRGRRREWNHGVMPCSKLNCLCNNIYYSLNWWFLETYSLRYSSINHFHKFGESNTRIFNLNVQRDKELAKW